MYWKLIEKCTLTKATDVVTQKGKVVIIINQFKQGFSKVGIIIIFIFHGLQFRKSRLRIAENEKWVLVLNISNYIFFIFCYGQAWFFFNWRHRKYIYYTRPSFVFLKHANICLYHDFPIFYGFLNSQGMWIRWLLLVETWCKTAYTLLY